MARIVRSDQESIKETPWPPHESAGKEHVFGRSTSSSVPPPVFVGVKRGTPLHFACKGPWRIPSVQESPAYAVPPAATCPYGTGIHVQSSKIRGDQAMVQISPCEIRIILTALRRTGWNVQALLYASLRPCTCCRDVCVRCSEIQGNLRTCSRKRRKNLSRSPPPQPGPQGISPGNPLGCNPPPSRGRVIAIRRSFWTMGTAFTSGNNGAILVQRTNPGFPSPDRW